MKTTLVILAWVLFVALTGAIVVVAGATSDAGHRALEYMPDMAYAVPYNTFHQPCHA